MMFDKIFGKKNSITILPHPTHCPSGEIVRAVKGKSLAETLAEANVEISHLCQFQCACTTCHIHLMEGASHISPMADDEKRLLIHANDYSPWSRLACQCIFLGEGDIVLELID